MTTQPESPDDEALFPVVGHLLAAGSDAERAGILLRLSDAVLLAYPMPIAEACAARGFVDGQLFAALRAALLCRTRDAHGLLPERSVAELEGLRVRLSHLAALKEG